MFFFIYKRYFLCIIAARHWRNHEILLLFLLVFYGRNTSTCVDRCVWVCRCEFLLHFHQHHLHYQLVLQGSVQQFLFPFLSLSVSLCITCSNWGLASLLIVLLHFPTLCSNYWRIVEPVTVLHTRIHINCRHMLQKLIEYIN